MHTCLKGRGFSESKTSGLLAPRSDRYTRAQRTRINKNRILHYGLGGLQFANGRKFQNKSALIRYELSGPAIFVTKLAYKGESGFLLAVELV
jgi:hypothetical protein